MISFIHYWPTIMVHVLGLLHFHLMTWQNMCSFNNPILFFPLAPTSSRPVPPTQRSDAWPSPPTHSPTVTISPHTTETPGQSHVRGGMSGLPHPGPRWRQGCHNCFMKILIWLDRNHSNKEQYNLLFDITVYPFFIWKKKKRKVKPHYVISPFSP